MTRNLRNIHYGGHPSDPQQWTDLDDVYDLYVDLRQELREVVAALDELKGYGGAVYDWSTLEVEASRVESEIERMLEGRDYE